jgi:hypothetical protein
MMEDIAPALIEQVNKAFKAEYSTSKKIKRLLERIKSADANYVDANAYAEEVGDILKRAFEKFVSSDALPDGKMYYNIADRLLRETLGNNYKLIADASETVQTALNRASDIGMKAIRPEMEEDRLKNLIDRISNEEYYDDIRRMIEEALVNYSQSVVDDSIRANVEKQYQAGLKPILTRKAAGGCCEWCQKMAGTWDYEELKQTWDYYEVFRRHDACRCTIVYDPGDGKKEFVYGGQKTFDSFF